MLHVEKGGKRGRRERERERWGEREGEREGGREGEGEGGGGGRERERDLRCYSHWFLSHLLQHYMMSKDAETEQLFDLVQHLLIYEPRKKLLVISESHVRMYKCPVCIMGCPCTYCPSTWC